MVQAMDVDVDLCKTAAEKFQALLRPIKDVALAFDVDVNDALEEYVEECVRYVAAESDEVINFADENPSASRKACYCHICLEFAVSSALECVSNLIRRHPAAKR